MKLVLDEVILSLSDVKSVMINRVEKPGALILVKVEEDSDWGILYKLFYRARVWLFGAVYENDREDSTYEFQLTMTYLDEKGREFIFSCSSNNKQHLIDTIFNKIKEALPHLRLQEINEAIMSE